MSKFYPPGTDAKTQDYSSRYTGSAQSPNVLLWHTTEGPSFPSDRVYRNGATAPNVTARVNILSRTLSIRGHFPANRSARALVNQPGGVETNTLNVFQVELVGTCDPAHRHSWGVLKAGIDYIYWPDAEDWALELIAEIPKWLHAEYPAFPIEDGAPRGWLAYPASYGNRNGQRMTAAEWNAGRGMLGHQHADESAHGDPGDLDIDKIVLFALGEIPSHAADDDETGPINFVDPNLYPPLGPTSGPQIVWLRERVALHLDALGQSLADDGADWSLLQAGIRVFQEAQGWSGADANGFVGPVTLARLAADPAAVVPPIPVDTIVELTVVEANLAYYNAAKGKARAIDMVPEIAERLLDTDADVLLLVECGYGQLIPMDAALIERYVRLAGGGKGREIYVDKSLAVVASGLGQVKTMLNGDDKPWAWGVVDKMGLRFGLVAFHNENQDGTDKKSGDDADDIRADQVVEVIDGSDDKFDKLDVPEHTRIVAGDGNSYSWAAAAAARLGRVDAFTVAADATNDEFKTHNNWRSAVTGDHFDLVLTVDANGAVEVDEWTQAIAHDISDHHIITTTIRFHR